MSTAAVVIPQAMAYAAIAGLPVEVGLYTASVPMAAYALAGTSRPLSVSVTSSIAAVTGAAVAASPNPRQAAATLALFAGGFLLAAWLLRLGFVADLISAPVLAGFKIGVGVSIAVGQLDSLLGVTVEGDRVVAQLWSAFTSIPDASLATWSCRFQSAAAAIVAWHRVDRDVSSGFPRPALAHLADSGDLVVPALGIALIAFVESSAAARAFQRAEDPPVVADRELGALGLANVVSSLLRGMPAGGGMSQTAVNDGAGAKSPLAAVGSAVVVIVTMSSWPRCSATSRRRPWGRSCSWLPSGSPT